MADDNPNPSAYEGDQGASDDQGMTPTDAVESAFNDWDTQEHGISEASRREWGPQLKQVADHEGTDVRNGINALVASHINKRYGSPEIKRQALGADIDAYQINPMPTAEAAPQPDAVSDTGGGGQAFLNEEQAAMGIQDFVAQNPLAADGEIQERMISVAADMRTQGFAPSLSVMFQHAVAQDPRYSEQARETADADQVARARAASVQVTGGGRSTGAGGQSSDVGDILDELVPR